MNKGLYWKGRFKRVEERSTIWKQQRLQTANFSSDWRPPQVYWTAKYSACAPPFFPHISGSGGPTEEGSAVTARPLTRGAGLRDFDIYVWERSSDNPEFARHQQLAASHSSQFQRFLSAPKILTLPLFWTNSGLNSTTTGKRYEASFRILLPISALALFLVGCRVLY
jgi:hypothetical protein